MTLHEAIPASDIDTILFDLDGTLLDTAGDMGDALNAILIQHGRVPLPLPVIRPHVSKGGMALISLGFQLDGHCEQSHSLRQEFLDFYAHNLSAHTRLFPGMEALLTHIEASHRRWGIVTNKPKFLTEPLLRDMDLAERVACVVCGDTLEKRKPDAEPLLHACKTLGANAESAVYIGDDERDITAGQRAGMRTIAAAYGYIVPGDAADTWGADAIVQHPDEIHSWLNS